MTRVQLLTNPVALPGKCVVCGFPGDGKRLFIDFGWQIDYYGAVYFCSDCLTEVLNILNYVTLAKHEELKADHAANIIKLETALKQIEVLRNVLRDAFNTDPDTVDTSPDIVRDVPSIDEVPQSLEGDPDSPIEPQSDADECSDGEGSDSVREPATRTTKSRKEPTANLGF